MKDGTADQPSWEGDDLGSLAQRLVVGSASVEDFHRAFLKTTLFLQAGDRPGFMALGSPPDALVPVWTSEAEMARSIGAGQWFSTTGRDLLGLLPTGYDLLIDPDGPAPLRLRPSALQRSVVVGWG